LRAKNKTVQLLTLYTDPGRRNAECCRRTDRRHYDSKGRSLGLRAVG